ncbi:MAG: four helix bundle protein [Armatimonadota bacterium]
MSTIRQFEDLIAWQKARVLAREIYSVTGQKPFSRYFSLADQIQRAATSSMSCISEGFERGRGEFHQFLTIAKGSCAEVRSQLYLACDIGAVSPDDFSRLMSLAEEVGRLIGGLRAAVQRQRDDERNARGKKSTVQGE